LIAVFYLVALVVKLDGRLKGMKHTLDQISKKTGVPLEGPIDDELRELINDGYDIKAVKKAREAMGLSLLEGKKYIDALKAEQKHD
jgi:hypothetical protein